MVSSHRKIADKIIMSSIKERLPSVFKGIQFGVGCPFGLEKMVHFVRLGHEINPGHDCANSDMSNAFSTISRDKIISETFVHFPEIAASTKHRLQTQNSLWYNCLNSGPAIMKAKTGVPQGAPKSPFDFSLGTLPLMRTCDNLAGEEGNSRAYMDDNYTLGSTANVQAVISHQIASGATIGLTLNMAKEIVKLGVHGSAKAALQVKNSYVEGWGILPENIHAHPADCPNEADKWGASTMGIPIGSPEYVKRVLYESESSPLTSLNKDFDSLKQLSTLDPQLAYVFLRVIFAGKLTHFLRGLLPVDSLPLAELFAARQREVLKIMLDVSEISDESNALACLGMTQGGAGLTNPVDSIYPAFISSLISSIEELQLAFPDIKDILADGQSTLPTVRAFHEAVAHVRTFDKQLSVKNLLMLDSSQLPKLQHILYRKVRVTRHLQFMSSIQEDNVALAIVGSGSDTFGAAWLEAIPKTESFTMSPAVFRTAFRNRLLVPHPQIVPNSFCSCSAKPLLDVRGIHLQKCKRLNSETIKTHDIVNEDLLQFNKCMGLKAYKIQADFFRITDASDGRRGDLIVHRAGHMPLVIDVTISNVINPDLKDKKVKPLPGVVTKERDFQV